MHEAPLRGKVLTAHVEKIIVSLIVTLLLVGFVVTTSVAWTTLAAVALLTLTSSCLREGFEPADVLDHVDLPLLVMIGSLFVVIAGARLTGGTDFTHQVAKNVFGESCDFNSDSWLDIFGSAALRLVLSNICSNVPTVMLLAAKISANSSSETDGEEMNAITARIAWLLLAWTSTVAGNLTLTGSIANLIVNERAANHVGASSSSDGTSAPWRQFKRNFDGLTFWRHFQYSWWSTVSILVIGSATIFILQKPAAPLA